MENKLQEFKKNIEERLSLKRIWLEGAIYRNDWVECIKLESVVNTLEMVWEELNSLKGGK